VLAHVGGHSLGALSVGAIGDGYVVPGGGQSPGGGGADAS
jgi:hypothetical protein